MNFGAFKRLFAYLGRHRLRLVLIMLAAVLATVFTVLAPAVTGGITSALYEGAASGEFDWDRIILLLIALVALYLTAQLFTLLQNFGMTRLSARVMQALR